MMAQRKIGEMDNKRTESQSVSLEQYGYEGIIDDIADIINDNFIAEVEASLRQQDSKIVF